MRCCVYVFVSSNCCLGFRYFHVDNGFVRCVYALQMMHSEHGKFDTPHRCYRLECSAELDSNNENAFARRGALSNRFVFAVIRRKQVQYIYQHRNQGYHTSRTHHSVVEVYLILTINLVDRRRENKARRSDLVIRIR